MSPKDTMCQVFLTLAKCFWRRSQKSEKFKSGWTDEHAKQKSDLAQVT